MQSQCRQELTQPVATESGKRARHGPAIHYIHCYEDSSMSLPERLKTKQVRDKSKVNHDSFGNLFETPSGT